MKRVGSLVLIDTSILSSSLYFLKCNVKIKTLIKSRCLWQWPCHIHIRRRFQRLDFDGSL